MRQLEQHFVYNSLNTIAALIRTDPARARDLVLGFADLSRAADGPGQSTLGRELAAVHAYLQLEQARFGPRLEVTTDVDDGLAAVPVASLPDWRQAWAVPAAPRSCPPCRAVRVPGPDRALLRHRCDPSAWAQLDRTGAGWG